MKQLFILVFSLPLLFSCAEKIVEGQVPLAEGNFSMSLTASLPAMPLIEGIDEPETKASTQYTVRINWTEGDRLSVINLTTGKLLGGYLTANSSGTTTTFSGSLSGTVNNGDKIAYFYPAQSNVSEVDFSGIHVDMSSQAGTLNSVPICVCAVVTADEQSFSFKNTEVPFFFLMSYMMICMSDIPGSAQIQTLTITNITNSFDLSLNAGRTGFDIASHVGNIVLTPNQTAQTAGVRTVYAAFPASEAASRSIILNTGTTTFETNFGSAALSNGSAYNTNVSGFLRDDMTFEDSKVRDYCLTYFDTNHDGKLTMVEIASVKSFPAALPSDILCFTELEYFYGLTTLPSFSNQTYLTSITIPKQITALPDEMFYGCSVLAEVYMKPSVPPVLGQDVFTGTPASLMIIVDDESVSAYSGASGWNNYVDNIKKQSSVGSSSVMIRTEGGQMGSENTNINI